MEQLIFSAISRFQDSSIMSQFLLSTPLPYKYVKKNAFKNLYMKIFAQSYSNHEVINSKRQSILTKSWLRLTNEPTKNYITIKREFLLQFANFQPSLKKLAKLSSNQL